MINEGDLDHDDSIRGCEKRSDSGDIKKEELIGFVSALEWPTWEDSKEKLMTLLHWENKKCSYILTFSYKTIYVHIYRLCLQRRINCVPKLKGFWPKQLKEWRYVQQIENPDRDGEWVI